MKTLGNILWILLVGIWTALGWWVVGAIFYITIVGIPLGRQAFKMAELTLAPFGKEIVYGGKAPSLIANIVWIVCIGLWEASRTPSSAAFSTSPSWASPSACSS